MKRIAIVGGGGHGKVCASIAEQLGYEIYFFDDHYPSIKTCGKWHVIGNTESLQRSLNDFDSAFVAIGNNVVRLAIQLKLELAKLPIANLISPSSSVHETVKLGSGILVVGNACINIDSVISDGCIVNTNSSIDHDCKLDRFCHISPGVSLAGEVTVGELTWVGIGSSVIQQTSIGSEVMVGAGSVVIDNIPNGLTVVGCPAKVIKYK
ncbi:acetyltransferase [Shewanella sp. OPT22]|nr:acetyltransferase [Shewanella sp. OPT22]